jgi:hypothetical protein
VSGGEGSGASRILEEEKVAHSGQWGSQYVSVNGEKLRQAELLKQMKTQRPNKSEAFEKLYEFQSMPSECIIA